MLTGQVGPCCCCCWWCCLCPGRNNEPRWLVAPIWTTPVSLLIGYQTVEAGQSSAERACNVRMRHLHLHSYSTKQCHPMFHLLINCERIFRRCSHLEVSQQSAYFSHIHLCQKKNWHDAFFRIRPHTQSALKRTLVEVCERWAQADWHCRMIHSRGEWGGKKKRERKLADRRAGSSNRWMKCYSKWQSRK